MIIWCIQVASCLYFCHSIYLLFHHHIELSVRLTNQMTSSNAIPVEGSLPYNPLPLGMVGVPVSSVIQASKHLFYLQVA